MRRLTPLLIGLALLSQAVTAQDFEPKAKRFSANPQSGGQLEIADVPGLIGLAGVAEQYNDQNKADGYYNQALNILNQIQHIEGERLLFSLKRFDKLLEDTQSPAGLALHGRLEQLISLPPQRARAKLTIGPETDTVEHDEPTLSMINNARQAFENRNLVAAETELGKAFAFEKAMKSQTRTGGVDVEQKCSVADTGYKLGVIYYYEGKYDQAASYFQAAMNVYDAAYGQNGQPSLRCAQALEECNKSIDYVQRQQQQQGSGM
jgi:tetratricopeptide (TPR) repeat protein